MFVCKPNPYDWCHRTCDSALNSVSLSTFLFIGSFTAQICCFMLPEEYFSLVPIYHELVPRQHAQVVMQFHAFTPFSSQENH